MSHDEVLLSKLLSEITSLNTQITNKSRLTELFKETGTFLYGFNPAAKVDREDYEKYVAFTHAVTEVLEEFGIRVTANGYSYITDAIMLIIDQNRLDIKLIDDVYPYIKSKNHLNSTSTVEHNIRNAIKSAYIRSKAENIPNRMYTLSKKPTNKSFLFTVTQEVCGKMRRELMDSSC